MSGFSYIDSWQPSYAAPVEKFDNHNGDLAAAFVSPDQFAGSPVPSIVEFADEDAAAAFFGQQNLSLSFTGVESPSASGVSEGVTASGSGQFLTTIPTAIGDSGGGTYATLNGVEYLVGILAAGNGNKSLDTYLTPALYKTAFATFGATPPENVDNLIFGSRSGDVINGSNQTASIISEGDLDIVLASSGDIINMGTGQNDVLFLPSAIGQTDPGTTVVLSPGTKTIVGVVRATDW